MEQGKEEDQEEEDDESDKCQLQQEQDLPGLQKHNGSFMPTTNLDVQHYIGHNLVKQQQHHQQQQQHQHQPLRSCISTNTPPIVPHHPHLEESNGSNALRQHQARVLTGMPLINFNSRVPAAPKEKVGGTNYIKRQMSLPNQMYTPQQIAILQHQHLNYIMAMQHHQQLQQHQQQLAYSEAVNAYDHAQLSQLVMPNPDDPFVPRIIKPRSRRRKQTLTRTGARDLTHYLNGSNNDAMMSDYDASCDDALEIDFEDEKHFLPTDLFADADATGKMVSSDQELELADDNEQIDVSSEKVSGDNEEGDDEGLTIAPIRPPSRALKHSESLQLDIGSSMEETTYPAQESNDPTPASMNINHHHSPLRKTFSWANSGSDQQQMFSLFPQTSQSDLLCSIRNNLASLNADQKETISMKNQTRKNSDIRSSHLEEALKSLNLESNDASISRKF